MTATFSLLKGSADDILAEFERPRVWNADGIGFKVGNGWNVQHSPLSTTELLARTMQ